MIVMMISCFLMQTRRHSSVSWQYLVTLTLSSQSLPQLSLRMSNPPALMAASWAGPVSLHRGGHRSPPSRSPRSATGSSRAHSGRITAPRRSCREYWELRRRAARSPIICHLLPVPLQNTWDPQVEPHHGRLACTCPRLASSALCWQGWVLRISSSNFFDTLLCFLGKFTKQDW